MSEVLIFLVISYIILYVVSLKLRDNSIVDVFWGFWFVAIAWITLIWNDTYILPQVLLTLLITGWWVRLTLNILSKKLPYKWEDRRYARWRKQWTYFKLRSFFQVYVLQGVLMFIISLPIIFLNTQSWFETNFALTLIGWLLALFWLLYESRADAELAWFIKNKKDWDILISGLRAFHRFPQYFWESVFWFGICIIASQISILVFVSWILITLLVRFVSGVPPMEEHYKDSAKYQKYSTHTPIFFPRWGKAFCIK